MVTHTDACPLSFHAHYSAIPEMSHDEKMMDTCVKLFDRLENDSDPQMQPSLSVFIESYQALPLMARAKVENWFIDLDELKSVAQDDFEVDVPTYRATYYGVDVLVRMHACDIHEDSPESKLQTEIRAMAQLRHPNIVSFLGANISCDCCAVVTECMPTGSLRCFYLSKQAQQRGWRPKKDQALAWALDLARAVTYLHCSDPSVTHRDIRPDTLFITASGSLKISGFGRCALLPRSPPSHPAACPGPSSRRSCAPGDDPYAAPELRGDRSCADPAIDVYSSAAVVRFLRAGRDPVPSGDSDGIGPGCVRWGRRVASLASVLAAAASADPGERPGADALMEALEEAVRLCGAACRVS